MCRESMKAVIMIYYYTLPTHKYYIFLIILLINFFMWNPIYSLLSKDESIDIMIVILNKEFEQLVHYY